MNAAPGNYATVNGIEMYYEVHGQGHPLVLIHGGGSTLGVTFGRIMPRLAERYTVIAVELQAHGRTSDRQQPSSFEQDADDVAALLAQLQLGPAHIFGFSNGASTTLQLAIRHPQVVQKIVVASTITKRAGAYPWFWEYMERATFDDMPQVLKDEHLKVNPSPEALRRMHDRDLYRMQHFTDIPDEAIRSITATALILTGDRDLVQPEHALELSRMIQGAHLAIVPGGHGAYIGELTTIDPAYTGCYPTADLVMDFLQ